MIREAGVQCEVKIKKEFLEIFSKLREKHLSIL